MTVGDRIAELLVKSGIDRVFGLPGGQTLPLYEGIRKLPGKIEHVLTRDERSAGFAADAYARLTRKVGVCDATVGPGATNLVSPLAEAFCASIPILAIISDIPRAWEYRRSRGNASQAIYQLDIFKSVSKWQAAITDPSSVDDMIETALRIATTGKPGPVVISVPVDIGSMTVPPTEEKSTSGAGFPRFRSAPDPTDTAIVHKALQKAEKPLLVVGGGAHISGAYESVRQLVDLLDIPIVTTISGKGVISETHPAAFGVVGTFGNDVANHILQEADFIFYIGCKVGQLTTLRFLYPDQKKAIAHLDIDPEEIGRNYPHSLPMVSDVKLGVDCLIPLFGKESPPFKWDMPELAKKRDKWDALGTSRDIWQKVPVDPRAMMSVINKHITPDDLIVCDASLASGWASAHIKFKDSGHSYIAPRGLATLGWGAPAAIGASLASERKKRIILLAGDGGFGYSVQELETMVRLKLPILIIIFNNSTLGWIKHIQRDAYDENYISTDFSRINYATVARGFGVEAVSVDTIGDFEDQVTQYKAVTGPILIDVTSDQWESPVKTLA